MRLSESINITFLSSTKKDAERGSPRNKVHGNDLIRPRFGIGIVSGAGSDGRARRERARPPGKSLRVRVSHPLSPPFLAFGCVATFILAKISDNCSLHPQLARDPGGRHRFKIQFRGAFLQIVTMLWSETDLFYQEQKSLRPCLGTRASGR